MAADGFTKRWGISPLCAYIAGILLPAPIAFLRPEFMPVVGLPVFAVLFWVGPFVSAAAVFWSDWSTGWRVAWVTLIPVFAAPTFIPLVV